MQNCRPPSFFLTNTTTLHQALWLGLIAPDSSISHRWLQTSTTSSRGIHLNCSLKGVSSVTFIVCLVEWVQPSSVGSNEKHVMVLGQESVGSIHQLWRPKVQPTQIKFIEQFPMSLPDSQFRGMRILGFSTLLLQLNFLRWFGHWKHCHHPSNQSFLSEGLWVSHTVSYHNDCLFTSLPQLCVHILYGEALWQRAIFCP